MEHIEEAGSSAFREIVLPSARELDRLRCWVKSLRGVHQGDLALALNSRGGDERAVRESGAETRIRAGSKIHASSRTVQFVEGKRLGLPLGKWRRD